MGAPYSRSIPGLDFEMLPLALIVVILGGTGSLLGAFVGSFLIGFLYNFGQAMFPDLAYVILFLPMVLILVLRPQGLFGRSCREHITPRALPSRSSAGDAAAVGRQHPTTSTSRARSSSGRCSRCASTCWWATAGLTSLGHAGLFAIAGYAVALMLDAGHGHFAASLAAVVVTLVATAVFAVLALRATGIGFLMITLALGQILWGIAYRWASLTDGDNGVSVTSGRRRSAST